MQELEESVPHQKSSLCSSGNDDVAFPLVWVTSEDGTNQEPASLLEEYEEMHMIQWKNTGRRDFVESRRVSCRRKRGLAVGDRQTYSPTAPSREQIDNNVAASPESTAGSTMQQNDDEDDEVQVLLTIMPPSTAKSKLSNTITPIPQSATTTVPKDYVPRSEKENCKETSLLELDYKKSDSDDFFATDKAEDHFALNRTLWAEGGKPLEESSTTTPSIVSTPGPVPRPDDDDADSVLKAMESGSSSATGTADAISTNPFFSARSSAYLQSLAEICHAILWDVRWRVGGKRQERLLAWERGDDLSAVHALARRYLPVPRPPPISRCSCLLCFHKPSENENCPASNEEDTGISEEASIKAGNGEVIDEASGKASSESNQAIPDKDEEAYDRSLNLYTRLYARKGPWFRVDDLFKYYLPKAQQAVNVNDETTKSPSPIKRASPSNFFLPMSVKRASPSQKKRKQNRAVDFYIDQKHVDRQLEAVVTLLQDLQQLYSMGLIRSFRDEEECGLTIGQIQKYGLLRQEEQRSVLAKLGGSRKQTQAPRRSSSGNGSAWNATTTTTSGENPIWRQMCQQQSIVAPAIASANKKATVLLPVSRHVDQTLVSSWATSLVLRAGLKDYIPQAILCSMTIPVGQTLQHLVKDHLLGRASGISLMCLRLREAPLKSLRRCSRLYLCATSGPGEMRGDTGNNAWKTLPDERISKPEDITPLPLTLVVSPPGSQCWHHTVLPGRDYRFKLNSCFFQRAYQPLIVSDCDDSIVSNMSEEEVNKVQVFLSIASFEVWELSVTLRSVVDYLLEANELTLYNQRKRARQAKDEYALHGELEDKSGPSTVAIKNDKSEVDDSQRGAASDKNAKDLDTAVDFMDVLRVSGRKHILRRFMYAMNRPSSPLEVEQAVESDVALMEQNISGTNDAQLKGDCEKVLGVIGIIAIHVLALSNRMASLEEVDRISSRPWLRHLWWEGCIAYLLWDIIPIFERRGHYRLATDALEILLFGKLAPRNPVFPYIPSTLKDASNGDSFLAQAYLSRRARGKAFERLVIDCMHIIRQYQKMNKLETKAQETRKRKRNQHLGDQVNKPTTELSANGVSAALCAELLQSYVSTGQITFCAARTLARRLKQPLSESLACLSVYEVNQLGHRLGPTVPTNDADSNAFRNNGKLDKKYTDWTPITDNAIANAMGTDGNTTGGRCSFVGFEEQESSSGNFGSLNVEQLALEFYNTGRLPKCQCDDDKAMLRGGWVGWHDEGGRLRAIFRILTSTTILGTDWECPQYRSDRLMVEDATIHLTPYQGAPFDLHVGAEQIDGSGKTRLGFYQRRKERINLFLARLEQLESPEVADLVFRSIESRHQYSKETSQTDPTLERDIQQARTLSALAAGFGGKMLAALCRCLVFDYRHYSGGLPDLTLFRAVYERDEEHPDELFVDLGTWIGEGFDPERQAELRSKSLASMVEDQDEEFLGCGKVGDSGRRNTRNSRLSGNRSVGRRPESTKATTTQGLPEKLPFEHEGRKVRVECMLVEVKSQNDRLDPRQEDWLNVLDRYGNVRVCKFGAPEKKANKKAK